MNNREDNEQIEYKQKLLECIEKERFPYVNSSIKWYVYCTPTCASSYILQSTFETHFYQHLNDYDTVDIMLHDLALRYASRFEAIAAIYRDWAGNNE